MFLKANVYSLHYPFKQYNKYIAHSFHFILRQYSKYIAHSVHFLIKQYIYYITHSLILNILVPKQPCENYISNYYNLVFSQALHIQVSGPLLEVHSTKIILNLRDTTFYILCGAYRFRVAPHNMICTPFFYDPTS
jgi:hypothetical protein